MVTKSKPAAAKRTAAKRPDDNPATPPEDNAPDQTPDGSTPEDGKPVDSQDSTGATPEGDTTVKVGSFMFTETEIPTRITSRSDSTPNPFLDAFPRDEKALVAVLDVPEKDPENAEKDHPQIVTLKAQARRAATEKDRTARVKVEKAEDSTDEKPRTRVLVWTVKRITRPRNKNENKGDNEVSNDENKSDVPAPDTDSNTVDPEASDTENNGQNAVSVTGSEAEGSSANPNTATE